LSYEQKLARARELIVERDRIDAELDGMFSGAPVTKRGRPRKESFNGQGDSDASQGETSQL
jgi:hypothetical protein